jgi:hypothetical protein
LPPFDHYQCYEVKPANTPSVTLNVQDRFNTLTESIRFPHRLCAPADKNGIPIIDPVQHLVGYVMTPPLGFTKRTNNKVANQFGRLVLDITRPSLFMVPSAKSLTDPPPPLTPPTIDHFQCYKVKRSLHAAKWVKRTATISDQFGSAIVKLAKPYLLCMPANKNGEDPTAPTHPVNLLCYKTAGSVFGTVQAHIANQFGPDLVSVIHRRELCVPTGIE